MLGRGRNIIEPRIVFQIWERDQEWLGCVGVSIRHESAANDQIEAWHKALLPVWERKHPLRVRFSAVQRRESVAVHIGGKRFGKRFPFGGSELLKADGIVRKIPREGEVRIRVNGRGIVEVKRDRRNRFPVVPVFDGEAHIAVRVDHARSGCPRGKQRGEAQKREKMRTDSFCPISHSGSSGR